ncbi:MAG: hypothetical protein ABIR81_03560 [Ginsengibacter sp.]
MIPKHNVLIATFFIAPLFTFSQENSVYSRYGLGNLVPAGNVLNKGMGGVSAGYADPATVNFVNPASYSGLVYTTLDIGAQVDSRTITSQTPAGKFTSNNAFISYLQLGVPLLNGNKKAMKRKVSWGMNIGLRPISRINYKVANYGRVNGIDSLITIYEGNGGANEAMIGTGVKIKNLSVGLNLGYLFGSKDYNTQLVFVNDSIQYQKSNSSTKTNFGGILFRGGLQYAIPLKKDDKQNGVLRLGAYGNLQQKINAKQDIVRETFLFNSETGSADKLDSVYDAVDQKGKIIYPSTVGVGFVVEKSHLIFGADFEMTNWDNYSFYGNRDFVQNNWTVKTGFQYFPALSSSTKFWNFVRYRAGFAFGPDYISIDKKLPQYTLSAGLGVPLKIKRSFYETQYSVMNLGVEYGTRGNNSNNVKENILRISIGFALGDVWFRRVKYQ